jgi:hypothetical protein
VRVLGYMAAVTYKSQQTKRQLSMQLVFGEDSSRITKTRAERLTLFFNELTEMPVVPNALLAYQQICVAMTRVENREVPEPFDPSNRFRQKDRMYAPFPPESVFQPVPGFSDVTLLPSKQHHIFIAGNGAIEVQRRAPSKLEEPRHFSERRERVVFQKPGADGHGVWR